MYKPFKVSYITVGDMQTEFCDQEELKDLLDFLGEWNAQFIVYKRQKETWIEVDRN